MVKFTGVVNFARVEKLSDLWGKPDSLFQCVSVFSRLRVILLHFSLCCSDYYVCKCTSKLGASTSSRFLFFVYQIKISISTRLFSFAQCSFVLGVSVCVNRLQIHHACFVLLCECVLCLSVSLC